MSLFCFVWHNLALAVCQICAIDRVIERALLLASAYQRLVIAFIASAIERSLIADASDGISQLVVHQTGIRNKSIPSGFTF
jgi:hypothetical protein